MSATPSSRATRGNRRSCWRPRPPADFLASGAGSPFCHPRKPGTRHVPEGQARLHTVPAPSRGRRKQQALLGKPAPCRLSKRSIWSPSLLLQRPVCASGSALRALGSEALGSFTHRPPGTRAASESSESRHWSRDVPTACGFVLRFPIPIRAQGAVCEGFVPR